MSAESTLDQSNLPVLDRKKVKDDLEETLTGFNQIKAFYPKDLYDINHWVAFRVHKAEFRREADYEIEDAKEIIFLPVPAALATQYTQTYNSEGIGVAGMAGAALGADLQGKGFSGGISSIVDNLRSVDKGDITKALEYYALQAAEENVGAIAGAVIGQGILGALGGAAAGQALKGAVAGAGLARNPYMSVMYDSPQFRTHNFQWKFVPRDNWESKMLRQIIHIFKYRSAPDITARNKHFFDYPEQFDIDFHFSSYLFNIGPSVLTSLEVNYHSEGQPLYFDIPEDIENEKAPVSVTINASFQEVFVVTKEGIKKQFR